jgi:hypothetical protein
MNLEDRVIVKNFGEADEVEPEFARTPNKRFKEMKDVIER